jgi:hypothetical protein
MRRIVILLLCAALQATSVTPAWAQDPCPRTPYILTELGAREAVIERVSPAAGVVTEYPSVAQAGARYIRIQVEFSVPPDCDWFLSVRDRDYRLMQTFGRENVSGPSSRWTARIPGDRALFDVQACRDGRQPTVVLTGYIWMPSESTSTYYSVQSEGQPRWQKLTEADSAHRRSGDFTGLLMGSFVRQAWSCTGVMIAPDLFLTNWHCGGPNRVRSALANGAADTPTALYWSRAIWEDMLIDLSWDGDVLSRELAVTGVAAVDESLDYAVLRVAPLDRLGPIRPAAIADRPVQANEPLRLVHHPSGWVKHISANCQVADAAWVGWRNPGQRTEFTHRCDTEAGSSGAPVLDAGNRLIGLHHLGFDYDSSSCRALDRMNKAIPIARILSDLLTRFPGVREEIERWR